jgi:hypothetical protein
LRIEPGAVATLIALVLARALASAPAAAQAQDSDRIVHQLVNFVVTEEHVRHLAGGLSRNEAAIDPDCRNVVPKKLMAVELVTPVELDIRSHPIAGTWQERWQAQACGKSVVRNALFEVGEDGRIAMFPLAPGTTKLSPSNQTGSVPLAIAMVGNRIEGCTDIRLIDTRLPKKDAGVPGEDWKEYWTFLACGETYRLTMSFSDAEGGLTGEPFDD